MNVERNGKYNAKLEPEMAQASAENPYRIMEVNARSVGLDDIGDVLAKIARYAAREAEIIYRDPEDVFDLKSMFESPLVTADDDNHGIFNLINAVTPEYEYVLYAASGIRRALAGNGENEIDITGIDFQYIENPRPLPKRRRSVSENHNVILRRVNNLYSLLGCNRNDRILIQGPTEKNPYSTFETMTNLGVILREEIIVRQMDRRSHANMDTLSLFVKKAPTRPGSPTK